MVANEKYPPGTCPGFTSLATSENVMMENSTVAISEMNAKR